ncbi:hypothetical protein H6A23_03805 [Olsenella uli]|uniref:hypothetical protein n=1 Tax=Olsenella uli TaxID=133926 RepID=UPI0019593D4D|nr:hypothetical protein [Olsenella uli]MBM6816290.1 hypothetical protein [Olsenella uli]
MSQTLIRIAALLLVAAVISLIVSFVVNVILGALSLLPIVLLGLAVLFFAKGGKVRIEFPDRCLPGKRD